MADLTSDPNDPRLGRGVDTGPRAQHEAYLILSEEERAKGFVRPVRTAYRHVGPPGPNPEHELRDLTEEERERWPLEETGYVKYEVYPEEGRLGRLWTQDELDKVGTGCGVVTTMSRELAETYAREPKFYGATYCARCSMHLPVAEFVWTQSSVAGGPEERVGS
jgi:hypothetical protein